MVSIPSHDRDERQLTTMMTPCENTRNLLARQPAERVGLTDSIWGDTLKKWVTQGYPTKRVKQTVKEKIMEDGQEVEKEGEREEDQPIPPVEHFAFDMAGAGGWFDMLPLRGHSEVVEETDEWSVTRNGAGAALK